MLRGCRVVLFMDRQSFGPAPSFASPSRERNSMQTVSRALLLSLSFLLASSRALLSQADRAAPVLAGLSNHGQTPQKPYVTAGTRTYLIGTQDGNFPDMGGHLTGEMGGAWLHLTKPVELEALVALLNQVGPPGKRISA